MKEFNKKYFNDGKWVLEKSKGHIHKMKSGSANINLNTSDGYCKKTTGVCEICNETYIIENESNKNHNFGFTGTEPYFNPDTGSFEEREKWICEICNTLEYRMLE